MNFLFKSLWIGEGIGLLLGFIFNIILIRAIFTTNSKRLNSYSYLFLVGAWFDLTFSIVELATQHQLLIKRGTLFVMPHGFERYLPVWTYPFFMAPHGFVILHGLYILAAQYHYRYHMITHGDQATKGLLLRNIAITSSMAFISGLGLGWGSVAGIGKRGYDFYLQFVDKEWMENDGNATYFRYACDTEDFGPKLFFYGGCVGATVTTIVVIIYGYKSVKFVQNNVKTKECSKRTKDLQNQFTKTLIAQTVSAFCFAFVPVIILVYCVAFKIDGKMLGTGVMSPVSWLPFANALINLIVVKDYRSYALSYLGVRRASAVRYITNTVSGNTLVSSNIHNGRH